MLLQSYIKGHVCLKLFSRIFFFAQIFFLSFNSCTLSLQISVIHCKSIRNRFTATVTFIDFFFIIRTTPSKRTFFVFFCLEWKRNFVIYQCLLILLIIIKKTFELIKNGRFYIYILPPVSPDVPSSFSTVKLAKWNLEQQVWTHLLFQVFNERLFFVFLFSKHIDRTIFSIITNNQI